ncbi:MAG TPA: ricin-type beta-trefoil lectin domain protein [Verrucomicrobiae bacterium]|jgi:hypothetical protein|nr:ricin-type beta-trefoil lectin domain protein [Verrucomicrobiae bacterium]
MDVRLSPHRRARRPQQPSQAGFIRQVILFSVVLIVALSAVGVYRSVATQASSAIPEIRSNTTRYCVDDYHNGSGPNALVDTWTCNGSSAQSWTFTGSAIKHGAARCLGVQNNGGNQGAAAVLNTCNGSPGQGWTIDLGGFENPSSGLCLTASADKDKAPLVISTCDNLSQPDEAWATTTWSDTASSATACNTGTEGQKVACYAEQQWSAWQSSSSVHQALLTDYTDGNSYEQWCADFVSYVYKEAGYPFTGGERDGWDEYDANNIQNMGLTLHPASGYTPSPGDVAFFNYPGGHVEIVATGGTHPTFIYGDSGTTDPSTGNGDMNEDSLTSDGSAGQVAYYLSPD